ncbi:MAG TPA: glycosyltransferase [Lachnospiraceae bacterium]|nr:glycosyltransferase [Lachnospiraceae bacterium]
MKDNNIGVSNDNVDEARQKCPPVLSIITVCRNAGQKALTRTMESVLAQEYKDFEYIIKDGGSTDETFETAASYEERFALAGITLKLVSEKDDGIYDAMNRAVRMSRGKWVNFMNAGDCFYNKTVLADIFKRSNYVNDGILYGDAIEYEYGHYYKFRKSFRDIESTMPFSHQSAFVNRELMIRYPFKTEYRIGADYDFLLSMYEKGYHFRDTGVVVCIISKDGVSSVKLYDTFYETLKIRESHGVQLPTEREIKRSLKVHELKQYVSDHFPVFIKKQIRRIQWAVRGQNTTVELPDWV